MPLGGVGTLEPDSKSFIPDSDGSDSRKRKVKYVGKEGLVDQASYRDYIIAALVLRDGFVSEDVLEEVVM